MRVLMIGPVPRIYGGISAVAGTILDSELPQRCQLTYLAEGTRRGPVRKLARFLAALAQSARILLLRRVDLVHLHVGDGASLFRHGLYLALGRLAGVPVLFHWHLPGDASASVAGFYGTGPVAAVSSLRRRLAGWALDNASLIVVLSESWRPALARLTSNSRIVVLTNPVDCASIRPGNRNGVVLDACQDSVAALSSLARGSGPKILFLGDFSPRKGARDLLAAAPQVLDHCPNARFVLCGDSPPPDVQALGGRLPLAGAVAFPGFVRGPDKLRRLQEAALLVLPSYAEGVPVALLEAMAAGLPIVTTPVGGIPDALGQDPSREDETGGALLVPPGDVDALAQALLRLLNDPALRQRMGAANRQRALAAFDVPRYVDKLLDLYCSLAQNAQPASLRDRRPAG